jgi:hypothetical protein
MEYAWKALIVPLPGEIVPENDNTLGINISLRIDEDLALFDLSSSGDRYQGTVHPVGCTLLLQAVGRYE